uniref:Uncharacterized protein n=1 Tax=Lepeophtheirus salmonis TaxID=72036 RepID=A0A0K2T9G6_LEPSM
MRGTICPLLPLQNENSVCRQVLS